MLYLSLTIVLRAGWKVGKLLDQSELKPQGAKKNKIRSEPKTNYVAMKD